MLRPPSEFDPFCPTPLLCATLHLRAKTLAKPDLLDNLCRFRANVCQCRANRSRIRATASQIQPNFGPTLVDSGPTLATSARNWPDFERIRPEIGPICPPTLISTKVTEFVLTSAKLEPISVNWGRRGPIFAPVRAKLANLGPESTKLGEQIWLRRS